MNARNQPSRIICAMPRASLRSVLLRMVDSETRMWRASTTMIGTPAGCSSRYNQMPSEDASTPTRSRRSAEPSRAQRIACGSVLDLDLANRHTLAVDDAKTGFLKTDVQSNVMFHRSSPLCQRPPKSLHQAPNSATAGLSPCTGFSKPDLKSRLNRSSVSVRILHVFRIFCSRSISGSLLQWRISDGASPLLDKGQQSVLVDTRCDLVSRAIRTQRNIADDASFRSRHSNGGCAIW